MRRVWSLLIFFGAMSLPSLAQAKDIWIHAVGIFTSNIDNNYKEFYNDADSFLKRCQSSQAAKPRDCHLYIDPNTALAEPGTAVSSEVLQATKGRAAPGNVLRDFQDALQQAENGDQIVLSLNDHGLPDHGRASCVFLGSTPICESELQQILRQYKKPGVRVLLVANACFSGSFTRLATQEVCTFVATDVQKVGFGTGFWKNLDAIPRAKPGITLSEAALQWPEFWVSRQGGGFGSQYFASRLCKSPPQPWSKTNFADWSLSLDSVLMTGNDLGALIQAACSIEGHSFKDLEKFSTSLTETVSLGWWYQQFQDNYCTKGNSHPICKHVSNYLDLNSKLTDIAARFSEIWAPVKQQLNLASYLDSYVRAPEMIAKDLANPSNHQQELKRYLALANQAGRTSAEKSKYLEAARGEILNSLMKSYEKAGELAKEVASNPMINPIIAETISLERSLCLATQTSVEPEDARDLTDSQQHWLKLASKNLNPTPKKLEQAKSCEDSFLIQ